jgi:hypothetical protein
MDGLFAPLKPLLDSLIDHLPLLLGIVVAVWLVLRFGLAHLIKRAQRWSGYEEKRSILRPASWFKIEPRHHFKVKGKILANDTIRKLYAPEARFVRDLREKERGWKLAWLSPYPDAVRASIKESEVPRGKKLDARRQIATAARQIEVCSLPEGIFVSGDPTKHYLIKLATVGKDPALIEKVENNLLTQLALRGGIQQLNTGDPTRLSYVAHEEPVIDPLTEQTIGIEWLAEHPAKSPYSLPLAIKQDGSVLNYNLHHGICGGASGTGKGSFIQAMIYQLAPFVDKGIVQLWFIDPKWSEAKLYERYPSKLVKRTSVGMDEEAMRGHAGTIADLKQLIARRIAQDTTSIEEGKVEDGRDFTASCENPIIVLFIDEYPTLYNGFNLLGKDGKTPQAELDQIVATGRSLGVFVQAATQKFDKTLLEAIRDNIANWWLLGQPSAYFNDLFLGENAKSEGYDSTAIPRSSKANGYATAGIGYAKDESGKPVKFRMPFVSKDDMAALIRRFRNSDAPAVVVPATASEDADDWAYSITDEDEDQLPELELLTLDNFEHGPNEYSNEDWRTI